MMYKYYNTDRDQLTIRLESAVPQNHLVRLIDNFVDTIPLDNLLKNLANTGRPAYHPALFSRSSSLPTRVGPSLEER